MKPPTYYELVECICGMALQYGMREDVKHVMGIVVKRGLRVERTFLSADEHCEDVLHRLGVIDDDGFVIGELPLTEEDARNRVKQAVHD